MSSVHKQAKMSKRHKSSSIRTSQSSQVECRSVNRVTDTSVIDDSGNSKKERRVERISEVNSSVSTLIEQRQEIGFIEESCLTAFQDFFVGMALTKTEPKYIRDQRDEARNVLKTDHGFAYGGRQSFADALSGFAAKLKAVHAEASSSSKKRVQSYLEHQTSDAGVEPSGTEQFLFVVKSFCASLVGCMQRAQLFDAGVMNGVLVPIFYHLNVLLSKGEGDAHLQSVIDRLVDEHPRGAWLSDAWQDIEASVVQSFGGRGEDHCEQIKMLLRAVSGDYKAWTDRFASEQLAMRYVAGDAVKHSVITSSVLEGEEVQLSLVSRFEQAFGRNNMAFFYNDRPKRRASKKKEPLDAETKVMLDKMHWVSLKMYVGGVFTDIVLRQDHAVRILPPDLLTDECADDPTSKENLCSRLAEKALALHKLDVSRLNPAQFQSLVNRGRSLNQNRLIKHLNSVGSGSLPEQN